MTTPTPTKNFGPEFIEDLKREATPDIAEARRLADDTFNAVNQLPSGSHTRLTVSRAASMLRAMADEVERLRAQVSRIALLASNAVTADTRRVDWTMGQIREVADAALAAAPVQQAGLTPISELVECPTCGGATDAPSLTVGDEPLTTGRQYLLTPEYGAAMVEMAKHYDMSVDNVMRAAIRLYQAQMHGSVKIEHVRESMLPDFAEPQPDGARASFTYTGQTGRELEDAFEGVTFGTEFYTAKPAAQAEPVAWMDPQSRDVIHAERKSEWQTSFGQGGQIKAATYTEPLYAAPTSHQPAQGTGGDKHARVMAMAGEQAAAFERVYGGGSWIDPDFRDDRMTWQNAWRAALAQAPAAEPLTKKRLAAVLQELAESIDSYNIVMTHWPEVARAVERAHGIGAQRVQCTDGAQCVDECRSDEPCRRG